MNPSAVEVTELSHTFGGTRALAGLSLDVPRGAFVSVVGPSGCGKSTLLKILAGLVVPTTGDARVGGSSAISRPGLVGYMPQRDLLLPWKRALDNACLGVDMAPNTSAAERRATRGRARELFERFGLDGFERAWPSELSGGMRQRLALLRTYLTGQRVMLLDEPFGALDAITRRDLQDWLQSLWLDDVIARDGDEDPRSALFVTHDVEEALFLSDTVHVMSTRPGRIVATANVLDARPRDPAIVTTAAFSASKATLMMALDHGRRVAEFGDRRDSTPGIT